MPSRTTPRYCRDYGANSILAPSGQILTSLINDLESDGHTIGPARAELNAMLHLLRHFNAFAQGVAIEARILDAQAIEGFG